MMGGEELQLKRALKLLVHSIGVEASASLIPPGKSQVERYYNQNAADWIKLNDLRELEANAPAPLVTMALCRMAGGVFVPHVDVAADEGSLAGMVMQLSKELGDVAGAISAALADDGRVCALEADAVLAELDDLARKQSQLRVALEAIRGDS